LGIKVHFTGYGRGKVTHGGAIYSAKAVCIKIIKVLIENAVYNNFGDRKTKDSSSVIGYLNFKAKTIIDGKFKYVRITVTMKNEGYFYYNHEVNKY